MNIWCGVVLIDMLIASSGNTEEGLSPQRGMDGKGFQKKEAGAGV